MHDVVLEHLKIGDEVVWLQPGRPVLLDKLDIGLVKRTLYHVDQSSNQDTLLAIVDFVRWKLSKISYFLHKIIKIPARLD
jgi:hypothetical protein